jgi:hypothetical protein
MGSRIFMISLFMKMRLFYHITDLAGVCGNDLFGYHVHPNSVSGKNFKALFEYNMSDSLV